MVKAKLDNTIGEAMRKQIQGAEEQIGGIVVKLEKVEEEFKQLNKTPRTINVQAESPKQIIQ